MQTGSTDRWQRIEELFECGLSLGDSKRARWLDDLAAREPDIAGEVAGLLASYDGAANRISGIVSSAVSEAGSAPLIPNDRFGRYRPVRLIAAGGMGAVFEAVRDEDYRKHVAVKVSAQHVYTPASRQQFERERQILADLEHPYIARLLDGGVSQNGLPYLVMEYVEGEPVTRYVRERGLPLRDRLILFSRICDAVGHAHESLIVHRDLKPDNILVTEAGDPKLLDFGVAKLLSPFPGDATFTQTTGLYATPAYCAPEQACGGPITTRTDVYSLGLILFELLSGTPARRLQSKTPLEAQQAIAAPQPMIPSEAAPAADARALRGDLDTITAKASDPDPARRYETVEQLRADIGRYLNGFPIEARPATASYRARKFFERYRWQVMGAGLLLGVIVLGLFATVLLSIRAQRERDQARWNLYKASITAAAAEIAAFRSTEALQLLDRAPEEFRGWEWRYLAASADTSERTLKTEAQAGLVRLAFSGESQILIGAGRRLETWDLTTGARTGVTQPSKPVRAVSGNGSVAAIGDRGSHSRAVIDTASGSELADLRLDEPIHAIALSGNGRIAAAASAAGAVRVWSLRPKPALLREWKAAPIEGSIPNDSIALNEDGSRIAQVHSDTVSLFDGRTGRRIAELQHPNCLVQGVRFIAARRLLTWCDTLRLWDEDSGRLLASWTPRVATAINKAAASPDGKYLISWGWHGEIQIWSPVSAQEILAVRGAPGPQPAGLAVSPGGRYLAAVSDAGVVKVFDFRTFGGRLLGYASDFVAGPALFPGGDRIAFCIDGSLEIRERRTGRRLASMPGNFEPIAVHPITGSLAAAGAEDSRISLWTREADPTGTPLPAGDSPVTALAFDPKRQRLAAGMQSGSIAIWNLESRTLAASFPPKGRVHHLLYSSDGERLIASTGDLLQTRDQEAALRIFDAASLREIWSGRPRGVMGVLHAAFFPGERSFLFGASNLGSVFEYDREGRQIRDLGLREPRVHATAITPDGTRALVVRSDRTLTVFRTSDWEVVARLHDHEAHHLQLAPDGSYALVQAGPKILIWPASPR